MNIVNSKRKYIELESVAFFGVHALDPDKLTIKANNKQRFVNITLVGIRADIIQFFSNKTEHFQYIS